MELDDDEWSEVTDPMITFAREPLLAEQVAEFLNALPELDDSLDIVIEIETEFRTAA